MRAFPAIDAAVKDGANPGAASEVEQLREKIARLEERVRQLDALAHLDSLLPIPNRRGFMRALDALISRTGRYGESAAMLFVDIDGLKRINDSFGHKAGDEALIQVARVLSEGVRKSDCVGRLGGDEFGVLLSHATEESARETADRLARQIEATETSFEGNPLSLGVAIGVTPILNDDTPEKAIARADSAMYREKSAAA